MGNACGASANIEPSSMPLYEPDIPVEKATFGMGCFWTSEVVFGCAQGVIRTSVGFASPRKQDYRSAPGADDADEEGEGTEVVRVQYSPTETRYGDLLALFWKYHNYTRQLSVPYMSAIFYHNEEQKTFAEASMREEQSRSKLPIVTQILPMVLYYNADEGHQKYRLQRQAALYRSLQSSGMKDVFKSHVATRLNGYVGGFGTLSAFEAEWRQLGISESQANAVRALIRTKAK